MRFRVKTRYAKDRHCWTTRPATPPQCRLNGFHVKEEPRNDENLELVDDDEDEDLERNEDVIGGQQPPSPPGRGPKKLSKGRVKLDLCLSHGDVMVMKGRDIQKYWEVCFLLIYLPIFFFGEFTNLRFIIAFCYSSGTVQDSSHSAFHLRKTPRCV